MIRPTSRRFVLILSLTGAMACDGNGVPVTPTTAVSSITGIAIERLPDGTDGSPIPGVEVQIVTAAGAKATTTDAQGLYRLDLVAGTFELRASKSGYEASTRAVGPFTSDQRIDFALAPILHSLNGRVTETAPTENVTVADARVEITSGSNRGKFVSTDRDGRFMFPKVWGQLDVEVGRSGFASRTATVTLRDEDLNVQVAIVPAERQVVDHFFWRVPPNPPLNQPEVVFTIPVHHAGLLTTRVFDVCQYDCTASSMEGLCMDVRDRSDRVVARDHGHYDIPPTFNGISLEAGELYRWRLYTCEFGNNFDAAVGRNLRRYDIEVTHPN